jgi:hypothetical protein
LSLDLFIDRGDISIDAVDPGQHPGQQEGVVVIEEAGGRLLEFADLPAHACPCQLREDFRVPLAADERGQWTAAGPPRPVCRCNGSRCTGFPDLS